MQQEQLTILLVALAALGGLAAACSVWLQSRRQEREQAALIGELRATRQELSLLLGESSRTLGETLGSAQRTAAEGQKAALAALSAQQERDAAHLQTSTAQRLDLLLSAQTAAAQRQDKAAASMLETLTQRLDAQDKRQRDTAAETRAQLEQIRAAVESQLAALRAENGEKLEAMRATVDEKLQKTLQDRLTQSFGEVSKQLTEVYKSLGEMQTLAAGVGDLKKVLANVKTRGILGEVQLGAILEQLLTPEQYLRDIATKPGSRDPVEFAIRLPGEDDVPVWLPIDAKFPADTYQRLVEAQETGDPAQTAVAAKALRERIRLSAKDIRDKYISPPATTEFAILFLPFEGLYAEVLRLDVVESLQRDYHVTVAGPTTLAALLNALRMGFQTLALQKRSGEIAQTLAAVKGEFEKFNDVLDAARRRLQQTDSELEKLVGARSRAISRRLRSLTALPVGEAAALLQLEDVEDEDAKQS